VATITLKGVPVHTSGDLPKPGSSAPDFTLTRSDLDDVSLDTYAGKTIIMNIVPSLDTRVCAASTRRFNLEAARTPNIVILAISNDLPFAQKRFCDAEGIDAVETLSQMRNRNFGTAYGIEIMDGPFAGLLARAVVVIGPEGTVEYTELVPEIGREPDYDSALEAAGACAVSTDR
jgi:thioredoxin-dependent peroxiredoxin